MPGRGRCRIREFQNFQRGISGNVSEILQLGEGKVVEEETNSKTVFAWPRGFAEVWNDSALQRPGTSATQCGNSLIYISDR